MPTQNPHKVDFMPPIQGGDTLNVTIRLSQTASQNTSLDLTFDNTGVINSVVGGSSNPSFPMTVTIPSGSDHVTVSFATNTVTTNTNVVVITGNVGADLSNSANWSSSETVQITT